MRKALLVLGIIASFLSCSSDDDSTIVEENDIELTNIIRITSINSQDDLITLTNLGTATTDISGYWLCLGPGTYVNIDEATDESTIIAPDANITLSYDVNETSSGLSLFSTNSFGSNDPDIFLDYVQWGAADQARVGQAVIANRWDDASNFVEGGPVYNFTGESDDFGSDFW